MKKNITLLSKKGLLLLLGSFILLNGIQFRINAVNAQSLEAIPPNDNSSIKIWKIPIPIISPFRTFNGKGNNLFFSKHGSADSELLRKWISPTLNKFIITKNSYEDGIEVPVGGYPPNLSLPDPRLVSNNVNNQIDLSFNHEGYSAFIWSWGQFLDHDVDLSPTTESEAFPIFIPEDDGFFCPNLTPEMDFFRSVFNPKTGTSTKNPRQQTNALTAWIDASQVYGSSKEEANFLRSFEDGKLRTSPGNLLPIVEIPAPPGFTFVAGDIRANENVALTALQTLFMREHNRLADYIAQKYKEQLPRNAKKRDEKIFQMARAIVGAEMQVITYMEYLPRILGDHAPSSQQKYNPLINPGISNVFSTAAFRFGHSMLGPLILRRNANGQAIPQGDLRLKEAFFSPQLITDEGGIAPLIQGLSIDQAQTVDVNIISDVRNFLFGDPNLGGTDLASLNIQRGRDHGIPSYVDTRRSLNSHDKVRSFEDISSNPIVIKMLEETYEEVDQVDLWVGGLAEDHFGNSLLGKTFTQIIQDQFVRLRDGDRFWYKSLDWKRIGFGQKDPIIAHSGETLFDVRLEDIIVWNIPEIQTIDVWNADNPIVLFAKSQNISAEGAADGSISLEASGDYSDTFQYQWSNGATTKDIENLEAGTYSVVVTDMAGNRATYLQTVFDPCPEDELLANKTVNQLSNKNEVKNDPREPTGKVDSYLNQNAPNPFNIQTAITYYVPETAKEVYLSIHNFQGQEIVRFNNLKKGKQEVEFSKKGLSAGLYYYRLVADGQVKGYQKMLVGE
ncbi:peroxidase family protein [Xanthovirga aplysinae]|uniref:peroxidase family protein n=1 Tax=Xanthovirga aplysinae TaxID=2529853 RepID=UPI0012BCAA09|nr:peroxidase family protein [Xanthovirga aplysinae]MTI31537.1 T9SS type A sorting domain-containing protein [Xanthovirga aplysinae]